MKSDLAGSVAAQPGVLDSSDTRWTYTYHGRLFEYEIEGSVVDQVDAMIKKLAHTGYSRRAQAVTWNARLDPPTDDPPCLQRVWGRLIEDDEGELVLIDEMHTPDSSRFWTKCADRRAL